MAVDRNAVLKRHKSNVKNGNRLGMNRSTVWKIVKKFQETGNTLDRPGRGKNGVAAPLNSLKSRGKSCDKTRAEATAPWPPQSV